MQYSNANQLRFSEDMKGGHYESYFLRANHPTKKQALWLRYTFFKPADSSEPALAELWGAYFDNDAVIAIQQDILLAECDFYNNTKSTNRIQIADSHLEFALNGTGQVAGSVSDAVNHMSWNLQYTGNNPVLTTFPEKYYSRSFPKAKVVVGLPNAIFKGYITLNGQPIDIDNWQGSENHNWGSKHTDQYAWGQVCGFDNMPDSFLECSTARVKIGPMYSPWLSLAVLRIGKQEFRFNGLWEAVKNPGTYQFFNWQMQCKHKDLTLSVFMHTDKNDVAGLNYRNPPGGSHTCLNSKVARCDVVLSKGNQVLHKLHSQFGGAFEILTDDDSHGVTVQNLVNKGVMSQTPKSA